MILSQAKSLLINSYEKVLEKLGMYHNIGTVHTWYDHMDIQLAVESATPGIHDLGVVLK